MRYWIDIYCIAITLNCFGQQTESIAIADTANRNIIDAIANIPDKSFDYIDKKYSKLSNDVQKQSEKLLKRMQDKEATLQKKLQGIDSSKAKELFEGSEEKYRQLQSKVQGSMDRTTVHGIIARYVWNVCQKVNFKKIYGNQRTVNNRSDCLYTSVYLGIQQGLC